MKVVGQIFGVILFVVGSFSTCLAEQVVENKTVEEELASSLFPFIAVLSSNQWVQGFATILITFTVSSLLTWLISKILHKVTSKTVMTMDDKVVALLKPPIYYMLIAIGVVAGLSLMPLSEDTASLLRRSIRTVSVVVWVIFFIRLASMVLNRIANLGDKYRFIQHRTVTLFDNIAKVVIFAVGMYAIFVIWSIDMTAWLASAGIAGIAIGFAAKDTLSNLFSGVFIIADMPFKVGDYVVLDGVGRGRVMNIGLRSTRILTRDDIEVIVPNSILGNSTIINQSGGPSERMRVRLPIGVAYGTDVDKVNAMLLVIATSEQLVCQDPAPRVRFRVFGASSLDFELLFWVEKPEFKGRVVDSVNAKVYKKFNEEGIEIPYAKQDVYIKGLPEHGAEVESLADNKNMTPGN